MNQIFVFLLLAFSNACVLSAQESSIPIGSITYSQETKLSADKNLNGYAILYFNTSFSKYIHLGVPPEGYTEQKDEFTSVNIPGDPEGFPVFKSHVEKKTWSKIPCYLSKTGCIVEDTLANNHWEIHSMDKKVFGNYECIRATGLFGQRKYEVWFTPDIPISTGPYKLGGLPGLIMEAQTLDGLVKFSFLSLEIKAGLPATIYMPDGENINLNYEQFIKSRNQYVRNKEKEFRAKGFEVSMTPDRNTIEIVEDK